MGRVGRITSAHVDSMRPTSIRRPGLDLLRHYVDGLAQDRVLYVVGRRELDFLGVRRRL